MQETQLVPLVGENYRFRMSYKNLKASKQNRKWNVAQTITEKFLQFFSRDQCDNASNKLLTLDLNGDRFEQFKGPEQVIFW